ncbi:hypothetical protein ACNR9Q_15315 [Maribacter sp. X9]|uniref:hypothetical protein n=1 Tax=Maribacter sp. X9 TaxID=3402159 RepID=UPI003AF35A9E
MLYNPHEVIKTVQYVCKGKTKVDLYDAITHRVVAKDVDMESAIDLPAKQARLIVEIPTGSSIKENKEKYYVGDMVVAFM